MVRGQGGRTASAWHASPYQTRPRWAGLAGRCLPLAGLLLGCGWVRGTEALQCYTTPDFPCEVDKGYAGGCIQDVGIIIDCTEANAKCKTIMRNGQPAYYFVNKSCDPGCKEDYSVDKVKNSRGALVRETVECCSTDKCNEKNLPRPEAGSADTAGAASAHRRHALAGLLSAVLAAVTLAYS